MGGVTASIVKVSAAAGCVQRVEVTDGNNPASKALRREMLVLGPQTVRASSCSGAKV